MKITMGADPKKTAILGGLLLLLVVVWLWNAGGDDTGPGAASSAPKAGPKAVVAPPPVAKREVQGGARGPRAGSKQQLRSSIQDFKPKLYDKENPVDPTKVDPTLAAQTMARLQNVTLSGGGRSLFDFGASQAVAVALPPGPIIKPKPKPKGDYPFVGPVKPVDKVVTAEVKPPPPPPPPIPLKFYGFVSPKKSAAKRAFFMEGEEIYIAAEGESMKNGKYRLVRIGVNSATVEDVANKNQQALPLIEEPPAGSTGGN